MTPASVQLGLQRAHSEQAVLAHACHGHTLQLSTWLCLGQIVVNLLEVIEREEGVVAIHLPIGSLKTRSGLELVPRCEPSRPTYQPISR